MSKRLSKEQLHDDEFVSSLYWLIGYVEENYPKILAGFGVIVVIGMIGYFIQQSSNRRAQAAVDALGVVQVALMQGNTSSAVTSAQSIIRDYEGEDIAGRALITLANIFFDQGRFEEATTHYRQFLSATDDASGPEAYGAWAGLAGAMEAQNDLAGAAQSYESYVQANSAGAFAPLALAQAARCHKMAGNTEMAKQAYQRILADYGATAAANSVKSELGMLGVVLD
jgi:TolA-binding protein